MNVCWRARLAAHAHAFLLGRVCATQGRSVAGGSEQAYYIFIDPEVPFSLRDANDTIVLGIRVVCTSHCPPLTSVQSSPPVPVDCIADQITEKTATTPRSITTSYFLTDLDGNERCVVHATAAAPAGPTPVSLGNSTVRGISNIEGWRVTLPNGQSTATYYVRESRGPPSGNGTGPMVMYPFRITLKYPAGGPEVGYVLDQGTHYPVAVTPWFDVSGCDGKHAVDERLAAAVRRFPPQAAAVDRNGMPVVVDSPHWQVFRSM